MKIMLCSNDHSLIKPNLKELEGYGLSKEDFNGNDKCWCDEVNKAYFEEFLAECTRNGYALHLNEGSGNTSMYSENYDGRKINHVSVHISYRPEDCIWDMDNIKCIIVHGGNTFSISNQIQMNGWFQLITKLVDNGIPYIGYSAGAIMATPLMLSAQWADSANVGFFKDVRNLQGFGFVPFFVKPHANSYMQTPYYVKQFKSFGDLFGGKFLAIYEYGAVIVRDGNTTLYDTVDIDKLFENQDKK